MKLVNTSGSRLSFLLRMDVPSGEHELEELFRNMIKGNGETDALLEAGYLKLTEAGEPEPEPAKPEPAKPAAKTAEKAAAKTAAKESGED